jgi:hypothetical protein
MSNIDLFLLLKKGAMDRIVKNSKEKVINNKGN